MGLLHIFKRTPRVRPGPRAVGEPAPVEPTAEAPIELTSAEVPQLTEAVVESAHRVADQLRLLHPAADDGIFVRAERQGDSLRIPLLEVERVGDGALPECVVVDPALHTAFLAGEVGRLLAALEQPKTGWSSLSMRVHRDRVALLGVTIPIDERRLWFGQDFVDLMRGADPAIRQRQDRLQRAMTALGPCAKSWERDAGVLRFTPDQAPPVRIRAEILGSFSPEMQSWCWAWANRSFESRHTRAITSLRDRAADRVTAPVLHSPGCDCSEPFAFALAYLAAHLLGERPIWRWPLPSGVQLFFATAEEAGWLR